MKLEILRSEQGVEIHLHNADGSITVWLCDSDQAAIFKLATLVFGSAEDPKMAKRSILVGDFEPEAPKREKPLSEKKEEVKKRLAGLMAERGTKTVPKAPAASDDTMEQFKELIDQLKKTSAVPPYTSPFIQPQHQVYPFGDVIGTAKPYVGDAFPWSSIEVDVNVTKPYGGAIGGCMGGSGVSSLDLGELQCFISKNDGQLIDTPVGGFTNSHNDNVSIFKTSLKVAG